MSVFVGLDCGGSSSRVLAVDHVGQILFQGQSGAANLASTPEGRLRKNLSTAAEGCPRAQYVCGCFAGLVSDDRRRTGEEILRNIFPGAEVRAEPDFTAAFYASPAETNICVIAGTGSLVCSKKGNQIIKSGGRGYILGDVGSGFQFGRDALLSYLDNPKSSSEGLTKAVQETFGALDEGTIIATLYKAPTPAGTLARLLKAIGTDAKNGLAYANASLDRNLGQLLDVVSNHVKHHGPLTGPVRISLAGGVWKASPRFKDRFEELANQAFAGREVEISRVTKPPLYGAVELAKEMANVGN